MTVRAPAPHRDRRPDNAGQQAVDHAGELTPAQVASVLDLAAAAAAADSVAPLSEHALLHLRYDAASPGADPAPGRDLILTADGEIAGYAYLDPPGPIPGSTSAASWSSPRGTGGTGSAWPWCAS